MNESRFVATIDTPENYSAAYNVALGLEKALTYAKQTARHIRGQVYRIDVFPDGTHRAELFADYSKNYK